MARVIAVALWALAAVVGPVFGWRVAGVYFMLLGVFWAVTCAARLFIARTDEVGIAIGVFATILGLFVYLRGVELREAKAAQARGQQTRKGD